MSLCICGNKVNLVSKCCRAEVRIKQVEKSRHGVPDTWRAFCENCHLPTEMVEAESVKHDC